MLHKIIFFICFLSSSFNICFGQQPKLMLPVGHTSLIYVAEFSKDGKSIVTASLDGTAKLWDTNTGNMIMDFIGHSSSVKSVKFSPDEKRIVTVSYDQTAKIWEVNTGLLIFNLIGHTANISSVEFSPDGNKIVTVSKDKTAKIWDVLTGKLLFDLKAHTKEVNSICFSRNGITVVTSSDDKTAKLWEVNTGKLLVDFTGHTRGIGMVRFSPDNKKIVTASDDNTLKIWDVETGKELLNFKGHKRSVNSAEFSFDGKQIISTSGDSTAKIWDAITGQEMVNLGGHTSRVTNAKFSRNGKKAVTTSFDRTAKIWDTETGKLLANLNKHNRHVEFVGFNFQGDKIVTTSADNTAKIWDINTGKLLMDLRGHSGSVYDVVYSPDSKLVITHPDNKVLIWDAKTGELIRQLKGHTGPVIKSRFSPDGLKIITASLDSTAKIWDVQTGRMIADLKGHNAWLCSVEFSSDNKKVVTAAKDNLAKIWDANTGRHLMDLAGHTSWVWSAIFSPDCKTIVTVSWDGSGKIWNAETGSLKAGLNWRPMEYFYSVKFSPDASKILTLTGGNSVKIWNADNGSLLMELVGDTSFVQAEYSPDGKRILTVSSDNTAKVWDALTGKVLAYLVGNTAYINSAKFNPDGKKIVTGSRDNIIKIWDTETGKLIKDLAGHKSDVNAVEFSSDGKQVVSVSNDNTCKIWNAETGELLYTFFSVDSTDYLVVDKFNRYDGTEAARKLLYFTCGTEVIELDQVKDQLWVPNLAERIIKGETINAKTLDELNICGLTPEVEDASSRSDEYYFKIKPRRGGMGETVLLVNGIEARRYKSSELKKNGEFYDLIINKADLKSLFIEGKENPVTVKAYTSDNAISSRGVILLEDRTKEASIPPNLYAVMIGVSEYKGDELDLKYAAKDAGDISNAVSNAAKKLLNNDGKEHVFMYNLTTAQEHYLLPEKNSIKKVLEEIGKKATANDILLIFFAGHGVMETEKKQFYFLTSDASKASAVSAIADVGISTAELTEWMKPQNIKAQKRILIFDACNSGQAIKDFVQLGSSDQNYMVARNEDKARQIKAIDKLNEHSGLFILSASASNQSAYEMGRYSQGLLTYSLLKAIKERPDILEAGKYLDVSRWFVAAKETVSEIAKESGARQDPQIVSNTNFNIGIVDDEVMAKIVLPLEKPLFAASNFQNSDEAIADDDLELSKQINLQLNDLAARGTDSRIVYATATNSTDAYSLSGRYTVIGNAITVSVNIKQNKIIKSKFEISGTKDKLIEMAAAVAEKAAGLVK